MNDQSTPEQPEPDGSQTPLSFEQVLKQEAALLGGKQRSALCISGGGIRSATFALGALQGLAELGILENFDYLSTVSGGGYIGSWLTAWKERWYGLNTPRSCPKWAANTEYHPPQVVADSNNNLQLLMDAGKTGSNAPKWETKKGAITVDGTASWQNRGPVRSVISQLRPSVLPPEKGPDPVQHLREYNNYLSPKLGFFSADTWTLAATVIRNMLLNWLVFIPLLMCALMLPRIVLSFARLGETYKYWYVPGVQHFFLLSEYFLPRLGLLFFAIGVYNFLRYLPGLGRKNHTETQFLKYCLGFFYLATIALITTDAWFTGGDRDNPTTLPFLTLWLYIGLANVAAYLIFAVTHLGALRVKWEELNKQRKTRSWPQTIWIVSLLGAATLASFSVAGGSWLLFSEHFRYLSWPVYVTFALPLLFIAFGLAVTFFVGFTSRALEDDDREWLARAGAWGLLSIISWTGLSALTLLGPMLLLDLSGKFGAWAYSTFATVGGVSGLISTLAGLSSKTKAQAGKNGASKQEGPLDVAAKLAAPVFVAVFLTSLGVLTNWILWKIGWVDTNWKNHGAQIENTRPENAVLLAVILLLFSWLMAQLIDINKFSLQAMYRSRLIRAYLGASNDKPEINKFTGFDRTDNCLMKGLTPGIKPFHIVNIALNLVAGKRLAWQQRKAASFTVSPLHSGNEELGYRPSWGYGGPDGISLGTAVAISGAAASPNMGYHSAPAVTFIMTLFNARLGSWLGNPKQNSWKHQGPHSAFDSIIREAFGLTTDTSPYVYLSDGGHFENLALYEMVRRRCRYIIVLDGGCDSEYTYEDLGNALRKIRIDMKVPIKFDPVPVPGTKPARRWASAEIRYKEIDAALENGTLIYIKPVILETEPPDVTAYKAANAAFPHESTGNQWFNESQTESYRMLGYCSVKETFKPWNVTDPFET